MRLLSHCFFCRASRMLKRGFFPFVVSYDTPSNITNVSDWLQAPAGKTGFVRADEGQLVTDDGPIRFWATNMCFGGCFPSHEQAERVAARMARFGINCVRMHHMDSGDIWGKSANKTIIDPNQLDKLDYFIYQLKRHGVYTNINLHVSRWLGDKEGFPNRDGRPNYDKGVGNFEPRMIEAQKQYAKDLLTHVNPYTKTAYKNEPAVAFVEISNEDALFAVWGWGQLDDLAEPYATTFRKQWNAWLRKKYGSTEKLREAWLEEDAPIGENILQNGDFTKPLGRPWFMERDDKTGVSWSIEPGGPEGRKALRVYVTRNGRVSWQPQFGQSGFRLNAATPYTFSFYARSKDKRSMNVNCMQAHEPWQRIGLDVQCDLTPQWKRFEFIFVPTNKKDDHNVRITFSSLKPGTYELADVSLRPGGTVGWREEWSLEGDRVPVMKKRAASLSEQGRHDFFDFLYDTEHKYWLGMYRYLKDDLGVKSIVTGTQLCYSPATIQGALDYIDAHAYWCHPSFPGRPWDPGNWTVRNRALVNSPAGTLGSLASRRIVDRPFTVSEYNHPAPLQYAAEGFPMIAAVGAFQSWDGVFSFTYSHSTDFEPRIVPNFFDIKSDPGKLVHHPACAAMFCRRDVANAKKMITLPLSKKEERTLIYDAMSAWRVNTNGLGLDEKVALEHAVGMTLDPSAKKPQLPKIAADQKVFTSDTGELRWDVTEKDKGFFTVDAPRVKLFTGFVAGRIFDLGDVKLRIGHTRLDWATISMTCIEGDGFSTPGRILVAATGWIQNTGRTPEKVGDDTVTYGRNWGEPPILCEGIPMQIALPKNVKSATVYPLDEAGNRRDGIEAKPKNGYVILDLGPEYRTLWYEGGSKITPGADQMALAACQPVRLLSRNITCVGITLS